MAKFVLGGIITNIAGSVGGTTLRRVPNGFSMYNKIKGASVSKLLQNARVPQIASIFQKWSSLSDSERAGWNATALTVTFPDKFGVAKNLTGRQLFTKANIQGLPIGLVVNDSAGFTNTVMEFSLPSFTFDISVPTFQITVDAVNNPSLVMVSVELSNKQIFQPVFKSRKVIAIGDCSLGDNNIQFPTELLAEYPYAAEGMWLAVYIQSINDFGMVSPYQVVIGQISA